MKRLISWIMVRYVAGLIDAEHSEHASHVSNCLVAAMRMRKKRGGYVIIGSSQSYEPILHAYWAPTLPELTVRSFDPDKSRVTGWRAIFAAPAFEGKWLREKIGGEK